MTEETLKRLLDENVRMAEVIRGSGIFARVEQIDAVRESILDGLRKGIYPHECDEDLAETASDEETVAFLRAELAAACRDALEAGTDKARRKAEAAKSEALAEIAAYPEHYRGMTEELEAAEHLALQELQV